jgi:hypothetical protein
MFPFFGSRRGRAAVIDVIRQIADTRTAIHGPRSEALRGQALTFHHSCFG